MFRLTPMVKNILLINVGIFIIQSFLNLPLSDIFGLRVVFSDEFAPYQFLTYMWIHGNFGHLFGNMFAVLIFGPLLEQMWGSRRFLIFYLVCGIGAAVLYGGADFVEKYSLKNDTEFYTANPSPERFKLFILDHQISSAGLRELNDFADQYYDNPDDPFYERQSTRYVQQIFNLYSNIPMVGASGAVFGILMAFAMLFPNMLLYLFFAIPVKAKYLVFFYGAYEIYAEISRSPGDNVAHLAHLGGMLIAYILLRIWRSNEHRYY